MVMVHRQLILSILLTGIVATTTVAFWYDICAFIAELCIFQ